VHVLANVALDFLAGFSCIAMQIHIEAAHDIKEMNKQYL